MVNTCNIILSREKGAGVFEFHGFAVLHSSVPCLNAAAAYALNKKDGCSIGQQPMTNEHNKIDTE